MITQKLRKLSLAGVVALSAFLSPGSNAYGADRTEFNSPEEATKALIKAIERSDKAGLRAIFGPNSDEVLNSGDPAQDHRGRQLFLDWYQENHRVEIGGDKAVLVIGDDEWPFPVPVVKKGAVWHFDTEAGKEELIDRRIGGNELAAIDACEDYVLAQREYYSKDRDGDGFQEYAKTFLSSPGKRNGLFWVRKPGEGVSPLAPVMAQAFADGHIRNPDGRPQPFHGYYFRILTKQGKNAPGGAKSYLETAGRMTGGFALVAYPARWGVSGVMTFQVGADGKVVEKNFGSQTEKIAGTIQSYDPDGSWIAVAD